MVTAKVETPVVCSGGPEPQDLLDDALCPAEHQIFSDPSEGMIDDDYSSLRQTERQGNLPGEMLETSPGRHHHGGDPAVFQLDEVVDTPRRARASIGAAGEHEIDAVP
jgi:hypothetical protein